jgi:hypothetical protein
MNHCNATNVMPEENKRDQIKQQHWVHDDATVFYEPMFSMAYAVYKCPHCKHFFKQTLIGDDDD